MWPIELSTKNDKKRKIMKSSINWGVGEMAEIISEREENFEEMKKCPEKFFFLFCFSVSPVLSFVPVLSPCFRGLTATHRDSKSSDYSLASCRSPSMDVVAVAAAGGCVAFDFGGVATRQTLSPAGWLNVSLGMMRMAWTTIHCRLRSLMDYHTIFEYSRCRVPLPREWVAWSNAVVLTVADVDYDDWGADGSAADGLDGVSVLPREAMYGNWLALTCCDDDMNAIRETVSPKKDSQKEREMSSRNKRLASTLTTHFIIRIMS
jgi:hypothetical protein